jgi:hypothetical protein
MSMLPHIRVETEGDHVVVHVADDELFDYVDDCFTEGWSLESAYLTESVENGRRVHCIHFPPSVEQEYVERAVKSLSPEEVERIWRLNNS